MLYPQGQPTPEPVMPLFPTQMPASINPAPRRTVLSFDAQDDTTGDDSADNSTDTSTDTDTSQSDSGTDSGNSGDTSSDTSSDSGNSGDTSSDSGNSGNNSGDNSGDSSDSGNSGDNSGDNSSDSGNSGDASGSNSSDSGNSSDSSGDNSGNSSGQSSSDSGDNQSGNPPAGGSTSTAMGSGTQADPWIIDNFAIDSANLPGATTSGQGLSEIITAINTALEGHADATIHIVGYTDNSGAADHNKTLSQQRADAAKKRLTSTLWNNIVTEGRGATQLRSPKSEDDDAQGHNARNRRVEIWYELKGGTDVNGPNGCNVNYAVQLQPQPNKTSCWAASMAMLVSYRKNATFTPDQLATEVSRSLRTSYGWDMLEAVRDHFGFQTISLPSNASLFFDAKQWCSWLTQYGPLWVTTVGNPSHAIIVAGLVGDGTTAGTTVYILNPWDTTINFSNDAVDFSPTNPGRTYNQTFDQFTADFANVGLGLPDGNWRVLYLPK